MAAVKSIFYLTIVLASVSSSPNPTKAQSGSVSCYGTSDCPFDDLSADEIKTVTRIVRDSGSFPANVVFSIVRTQEPKKSDWMAGRAFGERLAYAALFNLETNILTEVIINLKTKSIVDRTELPDGVAPPLMSPEYVSAEAIIRANPEWQAAVRKRGIQLNDTKLDIWAPGPLSSNETGPGKRILRAVVNYKDPVSRFWNWSVLEGLIVTVDLVKKVVTEIWDNDLTPLTPGIEELSNFVNKPTLKPLKISQVDGSSIIVKGQQIEWYKWKFQYAVDPIYGLQLYHARYTADCEERSVFYKISMAEMFVPYGASGQSWRWRNAFDIGEYGIGKTANPLKIGLDAPENALLFDCTMADEEGGEPIVIPGCVAAFERDIGMLYKHSELSTNDTDGRRGRVMVLTLMTTVTNYDYAFDYIFHMDGTMEIKTRLTGILLVRGENRSANDEACIGSCSSMLNNYLVGPPHQHFFNYRIDLDVDGISNYAVEVNMSPDPIGPENPHGNVFSAKKKIITEETFRDYNVESDRSWHVINVNSKNDFGAPRGYALKPLSIVYPYLAEGNPLLEHARFVTHPIWFTKYKDNEHWATDRFPRTGAPEEGVPKYISNNESLENQDVVLWYTFGVTHTTRPEEWPIMNVHTAGFLLIPFNFMSQNSEMPLKGKCP